MKKSCRRRRGGSRSAGMKLPPTLFSTSTVVRMLSLIFCAISRAMTSVAPPARPTSSRIGLPEAPAPARVAGPMQRQGAGEQSQRGSRDARRHPPSPLCRYSASSVAMMRSRVSGKSRMRLPSARATALPIAPPGRSDDLAEAQRRLVGRLDQPDVDLRHLGEAQDRVVLPGARRDLAVLEAHALLEHEARPLDDAALELVSGAVRRDHQAGIGAAPDRLSRTSSSTSTSATTAANDAMFL